jgi:DNA-binding CsgD family transcriptional regulator
VRQNDGKRPLPSALDGCDLVVDGASFRYLAVSHPPSASGRGLTAAEREVARLAALGQSAKQIAAARGTSARTVDHQLASSFRKLGVASRSELVAVMFAGDGSDVPLVR